MNCLGSKPRGARRTHLENEDEHRCDPSDTSIETIGATVELRYHTVYAGLVVIQYFEIYIREFNAARSVQRTSVHRSIIFIPVWASDGNMDSVGKRPTATLVQATATGPPIQTTLVEQLPSTTLADAHLLVISYQQRPEEWLADWHATTERDPAELGFIAIGQSTSGSDGDSDDPSQDQVDNSLHYSETIANATDLTTLGVTVSDILDEWRETNAEIVVVLDSLTTLVQLTSVDQAFKFAHALNARVKDVGGDVYYQFTPTAHDQQAVATLQSLMDQSFTP